MVLTIITVPEVPNNYTATLGADGTLEGTFVDSHNESGHFKLTNTYHLPAPKDNFRAQSVWSVLCTTAPCGVRVPSLTRGSALSLCRRGVAHVPFPFSMEVKTRSGNAFTGVVTWPTLENAQTKVKGTLANDQLKVPCPALSSSPTSLCLGLPRARLLTLPHHTV